MIWCSTTSHSTDFWRGREEEDEIRHLILLLCMLEGGWVYDIMRFSGRIRSQDGDFQVSIEHRCILFLSQFYFGKLNFIHGHTLLLGFWMMRLTLHVTWGLLCFNGQNNREKAWMMMTLFFLSPFSYLCLLEEVIRCIGALHQSYCSFVWWCIEMLAWWMKFIGTSGCDRWHARLYGVRNIWNDFVVIRDMKGAKFCSWKN